ncbi:hypothetical protein MLD38_014290 [Melastoma candidum]|uniref:Uncharacterized protein n=1 Tax=Melastoma candidum TaxID=119954 RepID=A0ACB9RCA5_9MYRT|nr:hypothetical protein MLD38_014290 [Melastoma candidum]
MGVSNNVTAVLNLIALLCSVPIISSGVWLSSKPDNECAHHLRWPIVILGTLLLLVALAGFVGAYWNRQGLLAVYLFAMALLIAALLFVTVFAFVVTRDEVSFSFPGRGYREYRLAGFSSWLREHVVDPEDWVKIRACLADSDVCSKLALDYFTADQFYTGHISPLQVRDLMMHELNKFWV